MSNRLYIYIVFIFFVFSSLGEVIYPNYCWHDVNLFSGTYKYPDMTLLNAISRTKTSFGKEALVKFLSSAQTIDISTLSARQQIIKSVGLLHGLQGLIEIIKTKEEDLNSFYDAQSMFYKFNSSSYLLKKFYYVDKNNANKGYRQLFFRKLLMSDLYNIFIKQYNNGFSLVCFVASYLLRKDSHSLFILSQFIPIPFFREIVNIIGSLKFLFSLKLSNVSPQNIFSGLFLCVGVVTTVLSYVKVFKRYRVYEKVFKKIQNKVVALQVLVRAIKEISSTVSCNSVLKTLIPSINSLLSQAGAGNDLSTLLTICNSIDINNVRYLSCDSVVVLSLFRIFYDYKDLFKNILEEIGVLDMYVSLSQLMREQTATTKYCYTTFISSPTPYVDIVALWNPLLHGDNIVTNDIVIGRDFTNMILCGHNGGGKSTYLKSLIISVLLSQTFGISPAAKMIMTPFKHIRSLSSINEELTDSDSLFISEIKRLIDYVKLCQSVSEGEFIFTVFDEPLHGTDSVSAVALLKAIFKYLANNNNLLHVISTHYSNVVSLESWNNEKFRNYLVQIEFFDDDRFKYKYKIIPGVSKRSVALNIATAKGLPVDIVARAKKEH